MYKKIKKNITELFDDIRLIFRGFKIAQQIHHNTINIRVLLALFDSLSPFIPIYMSAKIIDELIGERNITRLIIYVIITVAGTFILNIINRTIYSFAGVGYSVFLQKIGIYLNNVSYKIDYPNIEDPEINALKERVMGKTNYERGGIITLPYFIYDFLWGLFSVIIAITVSADMFITVSKIPQVGILRFINTYWASALLVLIIVLCIYASMKASKLSANIKFKIWDDSGRIDLYGSYYEEDYLDDNKAAKDIRIYNQRKLVMNELVRIVYQPYWLKYLRQHRLNLKLSSVGDLAVVLLGGVTYIFVGLKAVSKAISIGSVVKFYGTINQLIFAFSSLAKSFNILRNNNFYLREFFRYIDLPTDMQTGIKKVSAEEKYEIEFHNVSFKYPGNDNLVLKNFSLKFEVGEHLAVVGMNGSGKTTMIKLMCRLYDPTEGYITLNGTNIKEFDYNEYIALFSIVFQDFKLLAFSVSQNVAADINPDNDKVWKSLEKAGLSDRVKEFPKQLDHSIYKYFEEDGIEISGGEEQKLAIARALYKNSPIVILDEPTAALDPIAEYEIYAKFNEIIGNKTAVYISHRLSSCRFCDKIAVFHEGEMIQIGSHKVLLEDTNGKYFELWNAQAQHYTDVKSTK